MAKPGWSTEFRHVPTWPNRGRAEIGSFTMAYAGTARSYRRAIIPRASGNFDESKAPYELNPAWVKMRHPALQEKRWAQIWILLHATEARRLAHRKTVAETAATTSSDCPLADCLHSARNHFTGWIRVALHAERPWLPKQNGRRQTNERPKKPSRCTPALYYLPPARITVHVELSGGSLSYDYPWPYPDQPIPARSGSGPAWSS